MVIGIGHFDKKLWVNPNGIKGIRVKPDFPNEKAPEVIYIYCDVRIVDFAKDCRKLKYWFELHNIDTVNELCLELSESIIVESVWHDA